MAEHLCTHNHTDIHTIIIAFKSTRCWFLGQWSSMRGMSLRWQTKQAIYIYTYSLALHIIIAALTVHGWKHPIVVLEGLDHSLLGGIRWMPQSPGNQCSPGPLLHNINSVPLRQGNGNGTVALKLAPVCWVTGVTFQLPYYLCILLKFPPHCCVASLSHARQESGNGVHACVSSDLQNHTCCSGRVDERIVKETLTCVIRNAMVACLWSHRDPHHAPLTHSIIFTTCTCTGNICTISGECLQRGWRLTQRMPFTFSWKSFTSPTDLNTGDEYGELVCRKLLGTWAAALATSKKDDKIYMIHFPGDRSHVPQTHTVFIGHSAGDTYPRQNCPKLDPCWSMLQTVLTVK